MNLLNKALQNAIIIIIIVIHRQLFIGHEYLYLNS